MKQTIAIALSGGVDSMMAAHLLKQRGYQVIGIHFVTGYETQNLTTAGLPKIFQIADQLGIQVEIVDCRIEFKLKVVDYFTQTYLKGQTPNPCMVCNPSIKFGTILDVARTIGAASLATGHYARILKNSDGRFNLFKGVDQLKDQSYFLSRLTQKQLAAACFPLGAITKSEVLKVSKTTGLSPLQTKESQDICFVRGNNYKAFFEQFTKNILNPGYIEDINGKTIGKHSGLHLFTVGQRRGINCPASEPYYVLRLDSKRNRLVVGFKKDLFSISCRVENINWINNPQLAPIKIHTRIRYRHNSVLSTLFPVDKQTAIVRFERPQLSVTPGQGAVFYENDEVLGGGWISIEK